MKKVHAFFLGLSAVIACESAMGAITIKKAAPVATKQTTVMESGASLVPTVLGLVSSVKELSAKQAALEAECIPTSAEINFVNNTMKEWARTGAMSADEVQKALGMNRCSYSTGYATWVRDNAEIDGLEPCYDWFDDDGAIWHQYPVATLAVYCNDGSYGTSCSDKNKKTMSNIYEIFNIIDFDKQDYYTSQEITMVAKIMDKIESCSSARLSMKKRAAWGEFLTNTMSNVGQKTNTGTIMQSVSGLTQSGAGALGGLGSLGSIASQFLDK